MTNPNNAAGLERLADLIRERNANEVAITRIVGRPAQLGHIGEHIASRIFDIELEQDAPIGGATDTSARANWRESLSTSSSMPREKGCNSASALTGDSE